MMGVINGGDTQGEPLTAYRLPLTAHRSRLTAHGLPLKAYRLRLRLSTLAPR
ncbi:MAG: hypothetical protein IPK46_11170 [Saprospiraceae bacterium]|nr:hypothetical protein [Saprospiraceae bacterium]